MKQEKTNATRLLERAKIPYKLITYASKGFMDGVSVADKLGLPREKVYKTLVTTGSNGQHYVFVVPVSEELDLKAAARAVGEKSVSMLHVTEITEVTGYVRGGCSPVGMKKQFRTVFDKSCDALDEIYVSAGKLGFQMCISPHALISFLEAGTADVISRQQE